MPELFRSEAQRNEVCSTLCDWTGHSGLWTPWPAGGPSDRTARLATNELSPATPAEGSVARIAWALWTGRGELRFGDLLADCEPDARRAIDGLLEALLGGPEAVDAWVEEHGREGETLDREDQGHRIPASVARAQLA
jgi:hypothetical protein